MTTTTTTTPRAGLSVSPSPSPPCLVTGGFARFARVLQYYTHTTRRIIFRSPTPRQPTRSMLKHTLTKSLHYNSTSTTTTTTNTRAQHCNIVIRLALCFTPPQTSLRSANPKNRQTDTHRHITFALRQATRADQLSHLTSSAAGGWRVGPLIGSGFKYRRFRHFRRRRRRHRSHLDGPDNVRTRNARNHRLHTLP